MFPDVTAENFHVTPATKLNDSPANYSSLDITYLLGVLLVVLRLANVLE